MELFVCNSNIVTFESSCTCVSADYKVGGSVRIADECDEPLTTLNCAVLYCCSLCQVNVIVLAKHLWCFCSTSGVFHC